MKNLLKYTLQLVLFIFIAVCLFGNYAFSQNSLLVVKKAGEDVETNEVHYGLLTLFTNYRDAKQALLELERRKAIEEEELGKITEENVSIKNKITELKKKIRELNRGERKNAEGELRGLETLTNTNQNKIDETNKLLTLTESDLETALKVYSKALKDFRVGLWVYGKRFIWVIVFFVFVLLLSIIIQKNISNWIDDPGRVYKIQKLTKLFTWIFILIAALLIFLENIKGALTVIGLVGAGIAIALQDIFKSMVGWIILVGGRGIKPGDRIKVGDHIGDVVEIGVFRTRLLEAGQLGEGGAPTGRGILLTNNFVFTQPVINYHFGYNFIWTQMEIVTTFESDWEGIIKELNVLIKESTETIFKSANVEIHKMCLKRELPFTPQTSHVYMTIADSGYKFSMRFMVPPKGIFEIKHIISTKIAELFKKYPKFEFAYPTQRIIPTSDEIHSLEIISTTKVA